MKIIEKATSKSIICGYCGAEIQIEEKKLQTGWDNFLHVAYKFVYCPTYGCNHKFLIGNKRIT